MIKNLTNFLLIFILSANYLFANSNFFNEGLIYFKKNELDKAIEEALKKQQEEQERREQSAYDILDQLSQKEQEAREKYLNKNVNKQAVDYDW